MKLTHTHITKRKSGMTLLELTVVILVLLSLISILFVGARAWKRGSDRSANIMNLRNTQQAMRGHENMFNLTTGGPFTPTTLATYMTMPASPVPGTVVYSPGDLITGPSILWLNPNAAGAPLGDYGHTNLTDITGW